MADVEPVAKKSKQGPPAAATMLRVESSVLGPASAGRRDPPESKPAAVSPPEIVRDVNVVSDPPSPAAEPPLELAIISDPGEDLDDELAMVFLRHMVKQDPTLIVRCVVCNLRPATKRAALMRQTLDALHLEHVSVGVGSEVVPETKASSASWDFLPSSSETPRNGQELLRCAARPITLWGLVQTRRTSSTPIISARRSPTACATAWSAAATSAWTCSLNEALGQIALVT